MHGRKLILLTAGILLGTLFALNARTAEAEDQSLRLVYPNGLALDADGQLLIADIGSHSIYKCDSAARLAKIAGTGKAGFSGDDGRADQAKLNAPFDIVFCKSDGAILFADTYNHRIRRIDRAGVITTIAGNGKSAYTGDGGPATEASLQLPQGIAVDSQGNLFIADSFNHVVRRVDLSGVISTYAGSEVGLAGDDGPATKAQLNMPLAVAVDPEDRLYICDASNSRIRRVNSDGTIETIFGSGGGAGIGGAGFGGDGGPPARAKLFSASDVKFDPDGNWFISDSGNNRVRSVRDNVVATLAGKGPAGFAGDGGPAKDALLKVPQKLAVARDGVVYVAERANHRIRRIAVDGTITTFVGDGSPDVAIHVAGN